jgi:hypothetical protein
MDRVDNSESYLAVCGGQTDMTSGFSCTVLKNNSSLKSTKHIAPTGSFYDHGAENLYPRDPPHSDPGIGSPTLSAEPNGNPAASASRLYRSC